MKCVTHRWRSHATRHITHMNEPRHMHRWSVSHIYEWAMPNRITHMNEPCHVHRSSVSQIYEGAMLRCISLIWTSHVTCIDETCRTYIKKPCHTYMKEPCHAHEWVTSHTWMSQATVWWIVAYAQMSHAARMTGLVMGWLWLGGSIKL